MQPETIFLEEAFSDTAVFPNRATGRFNHAQLHSGGTYEVHGETIEKNVLPAPDHPSHSEANPANKHSQTRFASASSGFSFTQAPSTSKPLPLHLKKKKAVRKTVSLVRLEKSSDGKVVQHTVTDVIVKLACDVECCVPFVIERIKEEVGFDVVLINTKCSKILDNDATRGIDFWKSSRKVLAVSSERYEKLFGKKKQYAAAIDLTSDDSSPERPSKRPKREVGFDIKLGFEALNQKLEEIASQKQSGSQSPPDSKNVVVSKIEKTLECSICKSLSKRPMFSPCCNRLVGCRECVQNWLVCSNTCPLCNSHADASKWAEMKGMDDVLDAVGVQSGSPSDSDGLPASLFVPTPPDPNGEL